MFHFTQEGPNYQRNQQRRRFAKSALHHAGLESRHQNQGLSSHSRVPSSASSRRAAASRVSKYPLSKLQDNGRDQLVVRQKTWSARNIRKQGSQPCCWGTLHWPTLLGTTLPETWSSGLAGALGRSGCGAPKSGAPGWGAGRCKIWGALRFKTHLPEAGLEPAFLSKSRFCPTYWTSYWSDKTILQRYQK